MHLKLKSHEISFAFNRLYIHQIILKFCGGWQYHCCPLYKFSKWFQHKKGCSGWMRFGEIWVEDWLQTDIQYRSSPLVHGRWLLVFQAGCDIHHWSDAENGLTVADCDTTWNRTQNLQHTEKLTGVDSMETKIKMPVLTEARSIKNYSSCI